MMMLNGTKALTNQVKADVNEMA